MKKKLLLLASLILCISYSCNLQPQNNSSLQKSKDSASITTTNPKQVTPSLIDTSYHTDRWTYQVPNDTEKNKSFVASVFSPDMFDLKPMYNKEAMVLLAVMHRPKEDLIILRATQGAFLHTDTSTDSLRVRFDDNAPEEFAYYAANSNKEGDILIEPAKKFIAKLKKSKRTVIEVTFYKNGVRQIEFHTANLVWNH
jgi:hypothetical protein